MQGGQHRASSHSEWSVCVGVRNLAMSDAAVCEEVSSTYIDRYYSQQVGKRSMSWTSEVVFFREQHQRDFRVALHYT